MYAIDVCINLMLNYYDKKPKCIIAVKYRVKGWFVLFLCAISVKTTLGTLNFSVIQ